MNLRAVLFAVLLAGTMPVRLFAHDAQAFVYPGKYGMAAVDAHGVTHVERHSAAVLPAWFKDCIRPLGPDYPYSARMLHQSGIGYFRLQLDLKTGAVIRITVIQSTGFQVLDAAALTALRRWRWQPGKWQQVDVPVEFRLEQRPHPPAGAVRVPPA